MQSIRVFTAERLQVNIYQDRTALGRAAGAAVASRIRSLQQEQQWIRVIFAAAPSQNEFLAQLIREPGIDWDRVIAFHLDDYLGLPDGAPQRFRSYLETHLFSKIHPHQIHFIDATAPDSRAECARYSRLLVENPLDVACIGIGENGHIAFNDPPVADFLDPEAIKIVTLDEACRHQQVNDGCFPSFEAVPKQAFSVTISTIMAARYLYCMVPGPTKAQAAADTINAPVGTACPATILRRHWRARLFLDLDSAVLLK